MKRFQIFQSGTHVAKDGTSITFTEADLKAAAKAYDPGVHEAPLVVGHPKDDLPAYGWVQDLASDGEQLTAEPNQVETSFAEMVAAGRFKKISPSFYLPDAPANPVPGVHYLRHVAFLGAAAPAVKGMKPIEFAADEEGVISIEFGEEDELRTMSWAISSIGRLAQAIRDLMIEDRGEEEANKIIDRWEISELFRDAGRLSAKADDASQTSSAYSEQVRKEAPVGKTQEEIDAEAAKLAADKKALDDQRADFAEKQKADDRKDNARELQALVDAGKLAPGVIPEALDFMDGLDKTETLEFGEGDGKVKTNRRDWFLGLLKKSGSVIDFGEVSAEDGDRAQTVDFAAPDGSTVDPARLELHNKALGYQATHPNTPYEDALAAVGVR